MTVTVLLSLLLAPPVIRADEPTIEQLRPEADKVLRMGDVAARARIDVVFQLADRLTDAGRLDEAASYYEQALKRQPLNYAAQWRYATVLKESGKPDQAMERARIIINGCESGQILADAMAMLGEPVPEFAPLVPTDLPRDEPVLVLVPLGDVDQLLLQSERDRLAEDLGIAVLVRTIDHEMPAAGRDAYVELMGQLREHIEEMRRQDPRLYTELLRRAGLVPADMDDDDKLIDLLIAGSPDGPEAADALRQQIAGMKDDGPQWHAEDLLDLLRTTTNPDAHPNARFVAVTDVDIYGDDTSFLFGLRQGTIGVMSYRRFSCDFTGEAPRRDRLLRRAHNQLLASAGHVFGVERCSDPTCPRAYPHSLAEHDSKGDTLCNACQTGFQSAFRRLPLR